jgi:predicted Zn finger-like uncharacterized protein
MDVRCERCKARYAIPDEQITGEGLTLRCTACGHAFRVRRKELVVTEAVSGEEAAQAIPAHELVTGGMVATPVPQAAPAAESLILRSLDGSVRPVGDLATLQRWIAERRAVRDDELSRGGGPYLRLGLLPDLAAILGLVEAADRAARQPQRHDADPFGRAGVDEPPVQPRPPLSGPRPDPMAARPVESAPAAPVRVNVAVDGPAAAAARAPVAAPVAIAAAAPVAAPAAAAIAPAQDAEPLDDGELASVGRKRGKLGIAAAAALLALLGVAAWFFSAAEVAGPLPTVPPPDHPAAAAPPPAQPPPAPPAAEPPAPTPSPAPAAAEPPTPAPVPAPTPAEAAPPAAPAPIEPSAELPKKPAGGKARLAQARALRERGETVKALEAFQKLAREEPDNVGALTGRGLCYFELNQYGSAVASFQQALVIAPDDPDATMGLAETFRQMGKLAEAVALYQRYLDAHPDGSEAAVARNALSQLKE